MKCEICKKEYSDPIALGIHVVKIHKIKTEEYYIKYPIKKEVLIKKISETNEDIYNYEILTKRIISWKQKIKLHCKICDHTWETQINVLYRSSCPSCKNQITPTIKQFKEKLKSIHENITCLSTEYKNNKTSLNFICDICNHKFKSKPNKVLQRDFTCQQCKKTKLNEKMQKIANDKNLTITKYPKTFDNGCEITILCNTCKQEWNTRLGTLQQNNGCKYCNKYVSKGENEISEWLTSLNIKHYRNKWITSEGIKREIDIYIPEIKLAIDFHGLYWHSDLYHDKNYHKNKMNLIKNIGMEYVQIWENEWMFKQEIVKSIILNKLNKSVRIFARKCEIKNVNTKEAHEFFTNNHIQGFVGGKYKIGLYYQNELVSCMIIGKSRFNKNSFEMIRFANKINTNIIGGFSKLLNFIKLNLIEINVLESFIELRYFNGKGYLENDFSKTSDTAPDYYYFKNNNLSKLYHRSSFQKHKLKKLLPIFDEKLSEYENMRQNDYLRIYDAGNIKVIKKFN